MALLRGKSTGATPTLCSYGVKLSSFCQVSSLFKSNRRKRRTIHLCVGFPSFFIRQLSSFYDGSASQVEEVRESVFARNLATLTLSDCARRWQGTTTRLASPPYKSHDPTSQAGSLTHSFTRALITAGWIQATRVTQQNSGLRSRALTQAQSGREVQVQRGRRGLHRRGRQARSRAQNWSGRTANRSRRRRQPRENRARAGLTHSLTHSWIDDGVCPKKIKTVNKPGLGSCLTS